MTNREWLNTLSDEDFAKWCIEADKWDVNTGIFEHPFPRLESIKFSNISSIDGLLKWLKEERNR